MPQDRGLYMPVTIPRLDNKFLNNLDEYTLPEIAFHVAKNLIGDDIPDNDLQAIIHDAISFFAHRCKAGRKCIRTGTLARAVAGV